MMISINEALMFPLKFSNLFIVPLRTFANLAYCLKQMQ